MDGFRVTTDQLLFSAKKLDESATRIGELPLKHPQQLLPGDFGNYAGDFSYSTDDIDSDIRQFGREIRAVSDRMNLAVQDHWVTEQEAVESFSFPPVS